ncbi:MAG: amidohydrolase family protein [Acidobacteriota bacterium]
MKSLDPRLKKRKSSRTKKTLKIDIHVHVYGRGDGGTGCFMRGKFYQSLLIPFLKLYHGIYGREFRDNLDAMYIGMIFQKLGESPSIEGAVLLAHDRIYRHDGAIDPRTHLFTPNDYVLALVRDQERLFEEVLKKNNMKIMTEMNKKRVFAGVSVHPDRKEAIDEIHRCKEQGAVLIKLLPDSQNFDPMNKKYKEYYETLHRLSLPMLVHTGGEHILRTLNKEYRNPERLKLPLDCGVTVIAAHCGMKSGIADRDFFENFSSMVGSHDHFYGDTAALLIPTRRRPLKKLLKNDTHFKKLVHGSDIPVPSIPASLTGIVPLEQIKKIARIRNPFERDYLAKKAAGFPDDVFSRASDILNLKAEIK